MSGGGSKPGERRGGRSVGIANKRTVEREQALTDAARMIESTLPDAFAGNAHAVLMAIYKDPRQPIELRLDAAKAAIRYEKPALAATTVEVRDPLASMTTEHLEALHRLALAAVDEEEPALN